MQVHHRNFGEHMGLNERPVRNDHGKIKGLVAMLLNEIINFVRHREPKFERGHFDRARIQIISTGPPFINSGDHMPNFNSGFDERAQHRNCEFGCPQECDTLNCTYWQRCQRFRRVLGHLVHSARKRFISPTGDACSDSFLYSAIACLRCSGCIRSNINTPFK